MIKTLRPSVTFVNSSNMAPYILDLPHNSVRVVDLVDIDSEKWRAFGATSKGPMHFVHQREWRAIAKLEGASPGSVTFLRSCQMQRLDLFTSLHPDSTLRIRGVSNGVDHRYFDPALDHPAVYDITRPNFVFTGTMDYPPNVDAVTWFANEILPLIRRTLPAAQFYIVGNSPVAAGAAACALATACS